MLCEKLAGLGGFAVCDSGSQCSEVGAHGTEILGFVLFVGPLNQSFGRCLLGGNYFLEMASSP